MTIDISVIIPVYNGEKTIADTIDSVLGQSYHNFEILIVNDGSVDDTKLILEKYSKQDKRINVITQKNAGVSAARNKGLMNASGKYISFLDADDLYDINYLYKMFTKIGNRDICYCGNDYIPNSRKYKIFDVFTSKKVLINYIKGKIPVHTSTWLINKNLIKNNNLYFSENVSWGEDVEFFYNALALTDKIIFVREYLTYYRNNHSNQQLSSFSLDKIDKDYEFIMRIKNNESINTSQAIEDALLKYRLQALIVNKLWIALNNNYKIDEIKDYYKKYEKYIKRDDWSNGIRSLKLNFTKYKLERNLNKH